MIIKKYKYYPFLISLFLILNCSKDTAVTVEFHDYTSDFDSVWTSFDKKYPLFDYKGINWDAVYQQYKDQFSKITLEERNNKLIEIFKLFKDAHVYLKTTTQGIIGQYIPQHFAINFNEEYLTLFNGTIDWNSVNDFWGWGEINSVGYIRISSMHVGSIDTAIFDAALDSLKFTRGIIVDIRKLTGGNLDLCADIWNRFTAEKEVIGYQLYRIDGEHNDYAEPIPVFTSPRGKWEYTNKIIVLIGQMSFSIGEIFAETMSNFPNVITMGDTTFGGVEAPLSYALSDGTEYSVPIVAYLDRDKEPLEWKGVIPDIYFDPLKSNNNINSDIVLDEAFRQIKTNVYKNSQQLTANVSRAQLKSKSEFVFWRN